MTKSPLLVVGSVAYDDVETPHGHRPNQLGGAATYFSVAASFFVRPHLVGVVGRDFHERDRALLAERGVDLAGLETDATQDTFRWGGRYHENMNDRTTLFTYLNAFQSFRPKVPPAIQHVPYVFLANIDPVLQHEVLGQMRKPHFVGLDTMNFWIGGKRDELIAVLRQVDGLVINDEEGRLLTDRRSVLAMGKELQSLGPKTVIIKRGEYGAVLLCHDDVFTVPAVPLDQVLDPTGAGDTFAGGFMGWLARTGDLSPENVRRAVVIGSVMASFCVEGFGLERLLAVRQDEVAARYERLLRYAHIPHAGELS